MGIFICVCDRVCLCFVKDMRGGGCYGLLHHAPTRGGGEREIERECVCVGGDGMSRVRGEENENRRYESRTEGGPGARALERT